MKTHGSFSTPPPNVPMHGMHKPMPNPRAVFLDFDPILPGWPTPDGGWISEPHQPDVPQPPQEPQPRAPDNIWSDR